MLASAHGEVGGGRVRPVPGGAHFRGVHPGRAVLSVSQIARRAGLHLATASRLIAELEAHGLLDREPDRRVRVGVRMWELALRASPALTLREAAMPFMEDAHAALAEVRRRGYAELPGHVHEDALGMAVPVQSAARSAAVAALAAIVPVAIEARTVVGVLATAARGIGRTLGDPAVNPSH